MSPDRRPFDRSVMLGLHVHARPVDEAVRLLRAEARLAEEVGFDGVGLSEHHGGFPAYLPAPLLLAAILLGDLRRAFAAPAPLLLPLRPAPVVAEELAWLAAAHPGRVAVGVAPGYQRLDFDATGTAFDDRVERFWPGLALLCRALSGEAQAPLGDDAALAACVARPVDVVAGIGGPRGARRAAAAGAGILLVSHLDATGARRLTDAHAAAGGPDARVLIRRVWVGGAPPGAEALVSAYRAASTNAPWLPTGTAHIVTGGAEQVTRALVEAAQTAGATALNLRVHTAATTPEQVTAQLRTLGTEVLPAVRAALRWSSAAAAQPVAAREEVPA